MTFMAIINVHRNSLVNNRMTKPAAPTTNVSHQSSKQLTTAMTVKSSEAQTSTATGTHSPYPSAAELRFVTMVIIETSNYFRSCPVTVSHRQLL